MSSETPRFDRSVHGLERVWLAADRMAREGGDPPFVNQQVVEGASTSALTTDRLAAAMARAAAAWPGLAARLLGGGRWSRWTTVRGTARPGLRVVDGTRWDGGGPKGAPWLRDPLDPVRGPLAEVIHAPRCSDGLPRLVIRTHHAIVDGRAAGAFSADLFRVLRGEEPRGAVPGPSDLSLAGASSPNAPSDATPVLSPEPGCGPTWQRVTWNGPTRDLLPRVLLALAGAAEAREGARWRFSVPADLRVTQDTAVPNGMACANLTGLIRVDLFPDDTFSALRARIDAGRERAGAPLHAAHAVRDVPLPVLAWFGRRGAESLLTHRRSEASATVSNLGRADLEALACPGWTSARTWWIPPGSRGNACFVSLSGGPRGVELVASAPVPEDALARYLSRVLAVLDGLSFPRSQSVSDVGSPRNV